VRRRLLASVLAGTLAVVATVAVPHAAAATPMPAWPASTEAGNMERVIVRLAPGASLEAAAVEAAAVDGAAVDGALRLGGSSYVVTVSAEERAALEISPDVAWVQDDLVYEVAVTPNDPGVGMQPYLGRINAPRAWDRSRGSSGVVVAVLDTRVDTAHPDLTGKLFPVAPSDYTTNLPAGTSCPDTGTAQDHGTMVAGLVGAATGNGIGIAGVGWNTLVMPLRVLCGNGEGRTSTVAPAIRSAAVNGASIINLSISQRVTRELDGTCRQPAPDPELADAVLFAQSRGVLVVAAAGNDGCDVPVQPASLDGVIGVAATDQDDRLASGFSNSGSWVDIAAPGVSISSLAFGMYDNLVTKSGTSFAAPLVSGALALVVAANPGITARQAAERLRCAAERIEGTGTSFAWGRLDVARAVGDPQVGYWLANRAGQVAAFGTTCAPPLVGGSLGGAAVAMAATPSGLGYWVAGSDGSVAAYGDAVFEGSMAGTPLDKPVVGMAATRTGRGYWLVASDGGIFAFGDAQFYGSMGGRFLARPIVGMAPSNGGAGYWLVASDGGVFAFGDAPFRGSMGGQYLFRPVVGMSPSPSGLGYWMVASDGGVFAFGDAPFVGSTGGTALNQPITAITPTRSGRGYWFVATDGGVFAFGDAPFYGSAANGALSQPVVALAGR
jgi:subtilisin family serine protease